VTALKEVTELEGKKVILIGAGGASMAIAYGLQREKANATIYDRTVSKAKSLAERFGIEFGGNLDSLNKVTDYDIVINATSVGFNTNESVVSESFFKPNTVAMDVVFVPAQTMFLRYAKAKGATLVPGYRMLIHQALFQTEMFSGKKAPVDVMEKALLLALDR
jgi:shikimate dehydrogenase